MHLQLELFDELFGEIYNNRQLIEVTTIPRWVYDGFTRVFINQLRKVTKFTIIQNWKIGKEIKRGRERRTWFRIKGNDSRLAMARWWLKTNDAGNRGITTTN